ncbi:MAG: hypothetical protein V3U37_07790 [Nitrospinaceae bacterium]
MKILINGKDESASFEGDTLGELIDKIQEKCSVDRNSITQMRVDKREVSIESTEIRATPASQVETLEIEVAGISEIISRNITNAEDYLNKLIPGIERASELFRAGNEQEASQFFLKIIDGIDWFSQVLEMIIRAKRLDPGVALSDGKSIQARQNRLVELTRQMLDAHKNRDWVLLADLLEYELFPFYEQWSDFLPEFHQM